MTPEEILLPARGLSLAGLRWRNGSAQRVLCVHGWLDNAAGFSWLAPRLEDCDVVALDLPGHGRSAHRGAGVMQHFVEYAADVVAALDALGWDDAVLLGHSLGAGIVTTVAATFPERTRALLLLDGLAPQPSPDAKILDSLRAAITAARKPSREPAGYPDLAAAIVARREKGHWPLSDEAAAAILSRALVAAGDGQLHWRTDPRLRQPSATRLTHGQVLALLSAVHAPALLLGARRALFADPAAHGEWLAAVPGLRVEVIDAGHHLHLEPEALPAVVAAMSVFLAQLSAG